MKKFFILLIISVLVISLGCERSELETQYRIGISQCSSDPWRWQTNDEIEREMLFHDNYSVEIRSADDISSKQIEDIKYFIDNKFDLIIVNPTKADSITPIVKEAFRRGIPVVTFDRRISGDSYTAHIEVDNEAIGRQAADFATHLFPKETPIKVLELQGTSIMTPAQRRHSGFMEGASKYDNIEIVASPFANWRPEDAGPIADSILTVHPEINLIYAHSDPMAIAAVEAARKKGRKDIKATYRTCTVSYAVAAIKDDMSQDPKAFIGNAESVDGLGDEAKAAAEWMMANVPNARFVPLSKVLDGSEKLGDYRMIWCHLDWLDWPGIMWDTRDIFNDYYIKGGNILATRDGARYINDVWRIAKDQQSPNNMFGGEFYETLENDLGFSVAGFENHPLYNGLTPDENGRIMLLEKGVSCSNRTLQWVVDWDAYGDMSIWESKTGASALATGEDANRVHIAEFAPRDILEGYQSGRVVTIGTPGYEWYDPNHASNIYRENIYTLTKNAINYLCK